uniref:Uncharacterized protein n=1 Tax=Arundo donax TaxID=35708 RepID=A0A0A9HMF1_ARUDO
MILLFPSRKCWTKKEPTLLMNISPQ